MFTASSPSSQNTVSEAEALEIAELFSTLSDASRVKIVAALMNGPMNVQSLAEAVGISESGISHHMRTLRQMRVVRPRKEGRQVFYSLEDQHVADLFLRASEHIQHG